MLSEVGETTAARAAAPRPATRVRTALELPDWPPPLDDETRDALAEAATATTVDARGAPRPDSRKAGLEAALSARIGVPFVIATNSGTSALDLAVGYAMARRDGVVVAAAYGHPSSVRAAAAEGRLVLVDIDPQTLGIDPHAVAEVCARRPVACVVATHVAGQPAAMADLRRICDEAGAFLVEDCAHAHGAATTDGPVGALGDAGCFSFHWKKTVPAGEGGALCTRDAALYGWAWRAHDIGREPGAAPYDYSGLGGNLRMSEPCAALALGRLARLDRDLSVKAAAVAELQASWPETAPVHPLPTDPDTAVHGYHFLPLALAAMREDAPALARRLHLKLTTAGIPGSRGWTAPLTETLDARCLAARPPTPIADRIARAGLWIDHRVLLADGGGRALAETVGRIAAGRLASGEGVA